MKQQIKRWLSFAILYFFNCFPLKKNKIFVISYYGSQYGCNPKYITEYIFNHDPEREFDIVWAFNQPVSKRHLKYRIVKTMSWHYFYELCTSKVIISNYRMTDLFIKRNNQYYIQTWHSSLRLKQIERDAENVLPAKYVKMAKRDSQQCDLLLSGSQFSTEIFKRAFWYYGEIFEHGSPRNDLLVHNKWQKRNEVLTKLGVKPNIKILLYAPTFRKDNTTDVYNLDYMQLTEQLNKHFSGDWVILAKLHPHLQSKSSELLDERYVIDMTSYDDIQELLLVSDVLITDYSSLMFDFAITKRPCFLYVPDLKEYTKQDRKLYFQLEELPFPPATSNEELGKQMEFFKEEEYQRTLQQFLKDVGSYDDGRACEHLMSRIYEVCFNDKKGEVYEKAV